jgi:dethiobiotin synthetase
MRVLPINIDELQQLKLAGKSFMVVFVGSWQKRRNASLLGQLAASIDGAGDLAVFQVLVDTSTPEEDFCINELGIDTLPNFSFVVRGQTLSTLRGAGDSSGVFEWIHSCNVVPSFDHLLTLTRNDTPTPTPTPTPTLRWGVDIPCGRLFVSGDRSSVGKSSTCLALLGALIRQGVPPSSLAYIKPVTQCEAEQPVTQFCTRLSITHQGVGPVVFYKGFTRAYLAGETASADVMLQQCREAVEQISKGKTFVLVDGVGYPSVGSICNISNADVAKALGAPVLLVGKSGVGDAVDSHNLNAAYFEHKGVTVLGSIFNKLPLEGYYSLSSCRESVTSYFRQFRRQQMPYGFMPLLSFPQAQAQGAAETEVEGTTGVEGVEGDSVDSTDASSSSSFKHTYTDLEQALCGAVAEYVDIDRLLHDVWIRNITQRGGVFADVFTGEVVRGASDVRALVRVQGSGLSPAFGGPASMSAPMSIPQTQTHTETQSVGLSTSARKRSRAEVEMEARTQGAQGG